MLFLALTSAALLAAPVTSVPLPAAPFVAAEASNPHLDNARTAIAKGDLLTARREYRFAAVIDRDEGRLPVEASHGLAELLFAQSMRREAADVMQQLADEAARVRNVDIEARALISAAWLRLEAGEHTLAKQNVRRLREIARDAGLAPDTRALLKESLG